MNLTKDKMLEMLKKQYDIEPPRLRGIWVDKGSDLKDYSNKLDDNKWYFFVLTRTGKAWYEEYTDHKDQQLLFKNSIAFGSNDFDDTYGWWILEVNNG